MMKEIDCFSCRYENQSCYDIVRRCDDYDKWQPKEQPMKPKYCQLKLITPAAIYEAGKGCSTFPKGFNWFLRQLYGACPNSDFDKDIDFDFILSQVNLRLQWGKFGITHGFIEEVKERTYHVGMRFKKGDRYSRLYYVGRDLVQILFEDGTENCGSPIEVPDSRCITETEMQQFPEWERFELVEE